ncbi:MAG: hypothetical protein PWR24_1942 [Desulfonauticus sp.]|nr:MAG: Oxidoreductase molybdopterin binding protein [Desulfonauticus sp. 38_4375]MDK2922385.1 hypothetical protein [Desulfonauticus sp.]
MKFFPTRTVEKNTFRFDSTTGQIIYQDGKKEPYYLYLDGEVEQPLKISYSELLKFPQATQTCDFHCVEGWSLYDLKWEGIPFSVLIDLVKPTPKAKYVVIHSLGQTSSKPQGLDHYLESFPLEDLLNPELKYLLALKLNGKFLSLDRGAPLRVVAPFDLAYKSVKFVSRLTFSPTLKPGWWTLANPIYPSFAPVPQKRLRQKSPKRKSY